MLQIFQFIKNNFLYFIVFILVGIILLQRSCSNKKVSVELPKVKIDTVWVKVNPIIISNPAIIKTIPGIKEIQYTPDPNYTKLVIQYQDLVNKYTDKNIEKDTIKVDKLGYITIEDTISKNLIKSRKTSFSLQYPVITKTITTSEIKNNQIYYGGGLQGSKNSPIDQFNIGILLKTKCDNIHNVYTGMNFNGQVQLGIQMYWKIKL